MSGCNGAGSAAQSTSRPTDTRQNDVRGAEDNTMGKAKNNNLNNGAQEARDTTFETGGEGEDTGWDRLLEWAELPKSPQASVCLECHEKTAEVVYHHDGAAPCLIHCRDCAAKIMKKFGRECPSCERKIVKVTGTSKTMTKCKCCHLMYPSEEIMRVCDAHPGHVGCLSCLTRQCWAAIKDKHMVLSKGGLRCFCKGKDGRQCDQLLSPSTIGGIQHLSQKLSGDLVLGQYNVASQLPFSSSSSSGDPGSRPLASEFRTRKDFFVATQNYHKRQRFSVKVEAPINKLTTEAATTLKEWCQDATIPKDRRVECIRLGKYTVIDHLDNSCERTCERSFDGGGPVVPFLGKKVTCPYCSQNACQWCKTEWHEGENCVRATIRREAENLDETHAVIHATVKRCPNCGDGTTRWHGHGCHHMSPNGGCKSCGHHWCYVCRGPHRSCGCEFEGSSFCKTGDSKEDFLQHVANINGYPGDSRCKCLFCPDCRPNRPCASCGGACPVCRGWVPPGAVSGELDSSARDKVSIALDVMMQNPKDPFVQEQCLEELKMYYTLPKKVEPVANLFLQVYGKHNKAFHALGLAIKEKVLLGIEKAPVLQAIRETKKKYAGHRRKSGTVSRFTPLVAAAYDGDVEGVKVLMKEYKINVNQTVNAGQTSLYWACQEGHEDVIKVLLEKPDAKENPRDDIDVNAKDRRNGQSPLTQAAFYGNAAATALLLAHTSIDVNAAHNHGETPLWYAARKGHTDIVAMLLNANADVSKANQKGESPLYIAAKERSVDVVALLLGLSPLLSGPPSVNVNGKTSSGFTPLMVAAKEGHTDVVKLFVSDPRIEVNSKDTNGQTALIHASANGHKDVVQLLLLHTSVDANAQRNHGESSLWFASRKGHLDIVRMLMEREELNINAHNNNGQRPLYWAAQEGHTDIVALLLASNQIDVNAHDKHGQTALTQACFYGRADIVVLLLAHADIEVNAGHNHGETPLWYASLKNHKCIVERLLAHDNVDVNRQNKNGETAVHAAAKGEHSDVLKLLMDHPSLDVNLETTSGQSVREAAGRVLGLTF